MDKLNIGCWPTPIIKLEKLSQEYGKNLYLKRDDYSGTEIMGNKVRKLEFAIKEALNQGADTIITVGSIQSNHCRATAAVCAMYQLDCHLVLKETEEYHLEGNLFMDYILGANVHTVADEEEQKEFMDQLVEELKEQGKHVYTIPIGASNAVGTLGYVEAFHEIEQQEKEMNLEFGAITLAVGSGGTYAGLWLGNHYAKKDRKVIGYSVSASEEEFTQDIKDIVKEIEPEISDYQTISINDNYVGEGYAKYTEAELKLYLEIARKEGVIFDPCYTGKAFGGLLKEIQKGYFDGVDNILFIHTGGIYGWTEDARNLAVKLSMRD